MARKGERRDRWTGHGPPAGPPEGPPAGPPVGPPAVPELERTGDGTGWLEPGFHGRSPPTDPFKRRRPLGPKGYRRPDERIRDEVCERIARSGLDAREVEVAVQAGEVTLTGTALSRDDKRALEDLVDDVFGVEDVHNRLTLARAPPPGRRRGRGPGQMH